MGNKNKEEVRLVISHLEGCSGNFLGRLFVNSYSKSQSFFRVDTDLKSEPIGGKIKQAEMLKIPYIITIGNKEEESGNLAVRKNNKVTQIKKEDFIKEIIKENNDKI